MGHFLVYDNTKPTLRIEMSKKLQQLVDNVSSCVAYSMKILYANYLFRIF